MISTSEVRELLNSILDPCSITAGVPAGLCDMGLIRSVEVVGTDLQQTVKVTVGVTEPGCFMVGAFATEVRRRLLEQPGVVAVELELDSGFDWTEDHMSPAYARRLAEYRDLARHAPR